MTAVNLVLGERRRGQTMKSLRCTICQDTDMICVDAFKVIAIAVWRRHCMGQDENQEATVVSWVRDSAGLD